MDESKNYDVVYLGKFVWDSRKAAYNKKKHHISFEIATKVFDDKNILELYDAVNSTLKEDRYNVIGQVEGFVVLFVTTTERNGLIRIISSRLANEKERKLYYERATHI